MKPATCRLRAGIGDLVPEVAHRADEVVLAVGEDGRQRRDDVARDQVAVRGEVPGQVRMDSSKDIRRVGTFRSGLLVWVIAVAQSGSCHSPPARPMPVMIDYLRDFLKSSILC